LDRNSKYPFDSANYNAATLSQNDFGQLDSLFNVCVKEYNDSLTEGHDEYKIDIESKIYKRQLVAATNFKGEKEVWVNCFCGDRDKSWKREILMVEDGGPCYFNFKINLTTQTIYNVVVNGFA
jgi:hypothetical protein